MYAARQGHLAMVQLLLQYGMNAEEVLQCAHMRDAQSWRCGSTKLWSCSCDAECAVLRQTGFGDFSAVHCAALGGDVACLQTLLLHRTQADVPQVWSCDLLPCTTKGHKVFRFKGYLHLCGFVLVHNVIANRD